MLAALRNRRFTAYLFAAGSADAGFWVSLIAQGWLVVRADELAVLARHDLGGLAAAVSALLARRRRSRRPFSVAGSLIAANNIAIGRRRARGTGARDRDRHRQRVVARGARLHRRHDQRARTSGRSRVGVRSRSRASTWARRSALSALEWSTRAPLGPAHRRRGVGAVGVAAGYAAYAICVVPLIAVALLVAHAQRPRRRRERRWARAAGKRACARSLPSALSPRCSPSA